MNWKRGLFRAYVVLAVLFFLWATWWLLSGSSIAAREALTEPCLRAETRGAESWGDCVDRAAKATPMWGDLIAQAPGLFAIEEAVILATPVAVWWILRGLVALSAWVVRGFGRGPAGYRR
jgi:hypothetical protein